MLANFFQIDEKFIEDNGLDIQFICCDKLSELQEFNKFENEMAFLSQPY